MYSFFTFYVIKLKDHCLIHNTNKTYLILNYFNCLVKIFGSAQKICWAMSNPLAPPDLALTNSCFYYPQIQLT